MSGPRGLLAWRPEVVRPAWWWELRVSISLARIEIRPAWLLVGYRVIESRKEK